MPSRADKTPPIKSERGGAGNQFEKNGFVYLTPRATRSSWQRSGKAARGVPRTSSSERSRNLFPFGDDNTTRLTEHQSLTHYEDFIGP